jgi:hypothetical protein
VSSTTLPLTDFNRELGSKQGRVTPTLPGYTTPDGTYVFCLGYLDSGFLASMNTGDYVETYQEGSFVGVNLLRFKVLLKGPLTSVPVGRSWQFSIRIDDVPYHTLTVSTGTSRHRTDLAVNVSKLSVATHKLAFRLTLV